jgi:hypothetical protein
MKLLRTARSLIDQVNYEQKIIDRWTFGGGTAMMLQIGYRESQKSSARTRPIVPGAKNINF